MIKIQYYKTVRDESLLDRKSGAEGAGEDEGHDTGGVHVQSFALGEWRAGGEEHGRWIEERWEIILASRLLPMGDVLGMGGVG